MFHSRTSKIAAIIFILLLLSLIHFLFSLQTASFSLDVGTLDHVVYFNSDTGPVTLDYGLHKEFLDEIITMLTGNYYYVGRWNHRNMDGGGPDTLRFYDENDTLLGSFSCHQGYWAVEGMLNGYYRLYRHGNGLLDLPQLSISLNDFDQLEHIDYLIYSAHDARPARLDHDEHGTLMNDLYLMFQGDYRYVKLADHRRREGGGPVSLSFYDVNDNLLKTYYLEFGQLAVKMEPGLYKLYQHENGALDLSELNAAIAAAKASSVRP